MSDVLRSRHAFVLGLGAVALASVSLATVTPACEASATVCTPSTAGLGGERVPVRTALPGLTSKNPCNPHLIVARSDDDLRSAYAGIGVAIATGSASDPSGAIALPVVDWATSSVVVHEHTEENPTSWIAADGDTITVGSQGCLGTPVSCTVDVFAVDVVVSKAVPYSCGTLNCGGTSVAGG